MDGKKGTVYGRIKKKIKKIINKEMSTGKIGQWVWSGFYPERNNQTSNNSKTVGIEKDEVR